MGATTRRPEAVPAGEISRFDRTERAVHWASAALFLILIVTGAALYLQPLDALIGRRALVEDVHVWSGIALPLPLLVGLAGPWNDALRRDLRRFNRWSRADRLWMGVAFRSRAEKELQRKELELGKFNAGQKLNAAWTAGAGLVMLGTGLIMRWYHPWPLAWRTGATFVHDWIALGIVVVAVGHIGMALRHPEAMASMLHGRVTRRWARREAPAWLDGRDGPRPEPAGAPIGPRPAAPAGSGGGVGLGE